MQRKGSAALIILIIILVIFAIGGIWYYQTFSKKGNSTVSVSNSITSTSTPTSLPAGWQWYRNEQFGFQIAYPNTLISSTDEAFTSETSTFWFGTMSAQDVDLAPGRPIYSALMVMPGQCYKNYWPDSTQITTTTINGISMQQQSDSVNYWVMFGGDPQRGWDSQCNTILFGGDPNAGVSSSTYLEMLNTFQFIQ